MHHAVALFFFFKQKTAYEIVSGDWSSDVCSSDLEQHAVVNRASAPWNLHPSRERLTARHPARSEERRVGKECLTQCRSRWSQYHSKKKSGNLKMVESQCDERARRDLTSY